MEKSFTITYEYGNNLYVNTTNRCNFHCAFCLRHNDHTGGSIYANNLWLEREPTREEILASIEGKQMDIVLMNREAFDAFSQNGYLHDLDSFLSAEDPDLYRALEPSLVSNIVILEDNADDMALDDSLSYSALTQEHRFGLNLSESPYVEQAGFGDTVYLGIVANTPRTEAVMSYLRYLAGDGAPLSCPDT